MSIDKDTARRVAHLARIEVAEDRLEPLARDLSRILDFMDELNEVDVTGVEPMTSVTPMELKRRQDGVTDGGIQDDVLKNAPDAREGFFHRPQSRGVTAMSDLSQTDHRGDARDMLRAGRGDLAPGIGRGLHRGRHRSRGRAERLYRPRLPPTRRWSMAEAADQRIARGVTTAALLRYPAWVSRTSIATEGRAAANPPRRSSMASRRPMKAR